MVWNWFILVLLKAAADSDIRKIYLRYVKSLSINDWKKMLENRPEDALGSLVKTVETLETERRVLKYLTL